MMSKKKMRRKIAHKVCWDALMKANSRIANLEHRLGRQQKCESSGARIARLEIENENLKQQIANLDVECPDEVLPL